MLKFHLLYSLIPTVSSETVNLYVPSIPDSFQILDRISTPCFLSLRTLRIVFPPVCLELYGAQLQIGMSLLFLCYSLKLCWNFK